MNDLGPVGGGGNGRSSASWLPPFLDLLSMLLPFSESPNIFLDDLMAERDWGLFGSVKLFRWHGSEAGMAAHGCFLSLIRFSRPRTALLLFPSLAAISDALNPLRFCAIRKSFSSLVQSVMG